MSREKEGYSVAVRGIQDRMIFISSWNRFRRFITCYEVFFWQNRFHDGLEAGFVLNVPFDLGLYTDSSEGTGSLCTGRIERSDVRHS